MTFATANTLECAAYDIGTCKGLCVQCMRAKMTLTKVQHKTWWKNCVLYFLKVQKLALLVQLLDSYTKYVSKFTTFIFSAWRWTSNSSSWLVFIDVYSRIGEQDPRRKHFTGVQALGYYGVITNFTLIS